MLFLPTPAQAHTRTELDEWIVAWVIEADDHLNVGMIAEFHDMVLRHPYYFDPQPVIQATQTARRTQWTGNVEQWRPLVAKYFGNLADHAMCILNYETGETGDPNAKNPRSSAAGLFQFLRSTWNKVPTSITGGSYDSGAVYHPEANVAAAAWLQQNDGWGQWTVNWRC